MVISPLYRHIPGEFGNCQRADMLGHTRLEAGTTPTHSGARSNKPHANRKLRRQWKILAGENQVGISPVGGKLGLGEHHVQSDRRRNFATACPAHSNGDCVLGVKVGVDCGKTGACRSLGRRGENSCRFGAGTEITRAVTVPVYEDASRYGHLVGGGEPNVYFDDVGRSVEIGRTRIRTRDDLNPNRR